LINSINNIQDPLQAIGQALSPTGGVALALGTIAQWVGPLTTAIGTLGMVFSTSNGLSFLKNGSSTSLPNIGGGNGGSNLLPDLIPLIGAAWFGITQFQKGLSDGSNPKNINNSWGNGNIFGIPFTASANAPYQAAYQASRSWQQFTTGYDGTKHYGPYLSGLFNGDITQTINGKSYSLSQLLAAFDQSGGLTNPGWFYVYCRS
jgi:hypothetical protein